MKLKTKKKLPSDIAYCLWSYDLSSLDLWRDRQLIITQVLNYGTWQGVQWLFQTYPEKEIKEVIAHPNRGLWLGQVLNFWCLMLKVRLPKQIKELAILHMEPRFDIINRFFASRKSK